MLQIFRSLLYLYPAGYLREFGEEMASVFSQAREAAGQGLLLHARFSSREIVGLLCGAARERFRSFTGSYDCNSSRRLTMRRFPRSTIILMVIILAGVVLAMESARNVVLKYDGAATMTPVWDTFPGFFAATFALMLLTAVTVWAILFALRRTGMHRLSDVQTWPDQK